jgi:hypothetical protein
MDNYIYLLWHLAGNEGYFVIPGKDVGVLNFPRADPALVSNSQ